MKSKIAKPLRNLLLLACIAVFGGAIAGADTRIIEDGVPNAEIVIQKGPARPRMVALATLELQLYLQKMSGARLPIVTEPGGKPVRIYVGRSAATDRLGVTDKDLDYGAFRMVAGDDYLALLGRDWDFVPPEPWARNNGDPPRAQKD